MKPSTRAAAAGRRRRLPQVSSVANGSVAGGSVASGSVASGSVANGGRTHRRRRPQAAVHVFSVYERGCVKVK